MALQFPSDPASVGNVYEAPNGVIYYYDGVKWSGHGVPANVSLAEAAQDATAEMLASGVQTYIAVTYHDDTNAMDLTVQIPHASDVLLGGIKVGNHLSIDDDGVLSTNPYKLAVGTQAGDLDPPAILDTTKQVFVLGTGTWHLTDGVEGQICYFVMHSTGSSTGSIVNVDNIRVIDANSATLKTTAVWYPFDTNAGSNTDAKTTATAIFTEGAWNVSTGLVNP
jgi:hypothetical protein